MWIVVLFSVLALLCGMAVGVLVSAALSHKKSSGTVHMMKNSDDNECYIFLELEIPVEKLSKMNTVQFTVKTKDTHK